MRRVVVTGLGMVTPLGCGVETNWSRLIAGESGAKKIDTFEVSDISCRIAGVIPVGDGTNGTYNPDQWMEPKEQRKVDKFIVYAMCAARQALDDSGWKPDDPRRAVRHRRDDRRGHRRRRRHRRHGDHAARARAAAGVAVLHSRPHHQPRLGLCFDRAWAEGPELGGGHRLLDRLACDRRRRADDRARRCRRHGGGRHRIAGQPDLARGLCRGARALDRRSTTRRPRRRGPTTRIATAS